ncbi:MAG: hypothetical protein KJP17_05250 [Gammaproteobacteria bacterium]|nr:hypothetical protein [Gammaproteobacteria bacterium]
MHRAHFLPTAVILFCLFAPVTAVAQDVSQSECFNHELEEARIVFHRAWFEEADELFQAYLARCPNTSLASAYLAVVDMLLYRDSEDRIRLALQTKEATDDVGDLFVRAIASFADGKLDNAEKLLREYLEFRPTDKYALHFLGFTLLDQDKNDAGVRVLEDLLHSNPDYFSAKNHLAYGLLKIGKAEAAVRAAAEFVEADRGNPSAWDTKAQVLQSVGRREEAIASLSRSIMLDKRFAYGFRHLGNILASAGDNDAARAAYMGAIESSNQYGPEFVSSVKTLLAELDTDQH